MSLEDCFPTAIYPRLKTLRVQNNCFIGSMPKRFQGKANDHLGPNVEFRSLYASRSLRSCRFRRVPLVQVLQRQSLNLAGRQGFLTFQKKKNPVCSLNIHSSPQSVVAKLQKRTRWVFEPEHLEKTARSHRTKMNIVQPTLLTVLLLVFAAAILFLKI